MGLISILVVGGSLIAIICIGWVVYAKLREGKYTREKYAFRCVAATASLVLAAIAALSSRKGFADHFLDIAAAAVGIQSAAEASAPLSEKILICILVSIAIYFIMTSYKNWGGLISEQEAERRRTRRPSYMTFQAFEEARRLVSRSPERISNSTDISRRIYEISDPSSPEIIWHEHARELFELWYSTCEFPSNEVPAWDQKMKCWFGRETRKKLPLFLFCYHSAPSNSQIAEVLSYVNNVAKSPRVVFLIYKEDISIQNGDASNSIEVLSERFLLDNIVDFTDYFAHIRSRVTGEGAPDTGVTIHNIYAPSAVAALSGELISDDLGEYLVF